MRNPSLTALGRPLAVALLALAAPAHAQSDPWTILYTVDGDRAPKEAELWDGTGDSLVGLGDLDGDGLADFAVGAEGRKYAHFDDGVVRVFSGRTGASLGTLHNPGTSGNHFARDLVNLGDITGDGRDELAVSAYLDDGGATRGGAVFIFSFDGVDWSNLYTLYGDRYEQYFGWRIAAIDDLGAVYAEAADRFGGGEIVISSKEGGPVDVYAPDGVLLLSLDNPGDSDEFGDALATLDLDGDGVSEVVVGDPKSSAGRVEYGGTVWFYDIRDPDPYDAIHGGAQHNSVRGSLSFGAALANAGDVDADGVDDLIVGEPLRYVSVSGATLLAKGRVQVYSGATLRPLWQLHGEAEYTESCGRLDFRGNCVSVTYSRSEAFGAAVAGVGDVDGDGHADLFVGSPNTVKGQDGEINRGRVRVISGATGATLFQRDADPNDYWYGQSVASLGDMNGDGIPELGVGVPGRYRHPQRGLDASKPSRALVYESSEGVYGFDWEAWIKAFNDAYDDWVEEINEEWSL